MSFFEKNLTASANFAPVPKNLTAPLEFDPPGEHFKSMLSNDPLDDILDEDVRFDERGIVVTTISPASSVSASPVPPMLQNGSRPARQSKVDPMEQYRDLQNASPLLEELLPSHREAEKTISPERRQQPSPATISQNRMQFEHQQQLLKQEMSQQRLRHKQADQHLHSQTKRNELKAPKDVRVKASLLTPTELLENESKFERLQQSNPSVAQSQSQSATESTATLDSFAQLQLSNSPPSPPPQNIAEIRSSIPSLKLPPTAPGDSKMEKVHQNM
jgi:hypothetical protein